MAFYIVHVSYNQIYHKTLRQQLHLIKNYTQPFEEERKLLARYYKASNTRPVTNQYNHTYIDASTKKTTIIHNHPSQADKQREEAIRASSKKGKGKGKEEEEEEDKQQKKKKENNALHYVVVAGVVTVVGLAAVNLYQLIRRSIPMPMNQVKGILYIPQGRHQVRFSPDRYKLGHNDVYVEIDPRQYNKLLINVGKHNKVKHTSTYEEPHTGIHHLFFAFEDMPYVTVHMKTFFKALPPNVMLNGIEKIEETSNMTQMRWSEMHNFMNAPGIRVTSLYPIDNRVIHTLSIKDSKIPEYGKIYDHHYKRFNMIHTGRQRLRRWNPFMKNIEWSP